MPNLDDDCSAADQRWAERELEHLDTCPACGSKRLEPSLQGCPNPDDFGGQRWAYSRCIACRSRFLNPRPSEDTIARAYEGDAYYTHSEPGAVESWPATRGAAVRERILKGYVNERFGYRLAPAASIGRIVMPLLPGARGMASSYVRHLAAPERDDRLLDIGCGNGEFLLRMRAAGWQVDGIEIDAAARAYAEQAGLHVYPSQLTEQMFPFETFAAITMNHVIEHLHDPRSLLAICYRLLRPGGALWIAAPNGSAMGLDRYGPNWAPLDPPRHLVHFTPDALRRALVEAGFDEVFTPPPTLLAARWTYRMSRSFAESGVRTLAPVQSAIGDVAASVVADLRALAQPSVGEELVMGGRKAKAIVAPDR